MPNVKIVSLVLILLMTLTTFITQKQLLVKGIANADSNPFLQQQKLLVYVFPLMFAVFGINFPIGVLIYWLTTNLWSMGQQWYVIRNNPAPGSPRLRRVGGAAGPEGRQARRRAVRACRRPSLSPSTDPQARAQPAETAATQPAQGAASGPAEEDSDHRPPDQEDA